MIQLAWSKTTFAASQSHKCLNKELFLESAIIISRIGIYATFVQRYVHFSYVRNTCDFCLLIAWLLAIKRNSCLIQTQNLLLFLRYWGCYETPKTWFKTISFCRTRWSDLSINMVFPFWFVYNTEYVNVNKNR